MTATTTTLPASTANHKLVFKTVNDSPGHPHLEAAREQVSSSGFRDWAEKPGCVSFRPLWTRIERSIAHGTNNHLAREQSKEIVPSDPAGIHWTPQD